MYAIMTLQSRDFVLFCQSLMTEGLQASKAQYATIQQSRNQSLQEYYDNFSKLNSSYSLSDHLSLQLFFQHLSSPLRSHVAHLYILAEDHGDSVPVFYNRWSSSWRSFLCNLPRLPSFHLHPLCLTPDLFVLIAANDIRQTVVSRRSHTYVRPITTLSATTRAATMPPFHL